METEPGLKVSFERLVKPGIEPATPGLQGEGFIHDTMAAPTHSIRISEILPWNRKSRFYPGIENLILPRLSYPGCHLRATYIGCIGTHAHGHQVMSLLC